MNLSGDAVVMNLRAYRVPPENLLVIYDDIDLPKGALRLRAGGGAGTHNGVRHITERLGGGTFKRIRIGAGPAPENVPLADYVLSDIDGESARTIAPALTRAAAAAREFISGTDFGLIMTRFNTNP
jgi:PTH1 family peptidyl-tRNA hydrolase